MRILTVTPIKRGIAKDSLTYYTTLPVEPGALVSVPLRKNHVPALVMRADGVVEAKSAIKAQGFSLKKVKSVLAEHFFTEPFLRAVEMMAEYSASSAGAVFASLVPAAVFEENLSLSIPKREQSAVSLPRDKNVLQASLQERLGAYKKLIREEFASGKSVFCIAPTVEETRFFEEALKKGIEEYSFLLNGSLKKKSLIERWKKAAEEPHPVLIVSTGSFLAIPRQDIGTIIVEHENARSYKMQSRPFADIRTFAEIFARVSGARLVLGDSLLRVETLHREAEAELVPLEHLVFRSPASAVQEIVDVRRKHGSDELWKPLSDTLLEMIRRTEERGEQMYIYASHKGFAPTTLCRDCGEVVACRNCRAPVVLHLSDDEDEPNRFICHRCGLSRSAKETCIRCGSWRLAEYGVGAERIQTEMRKHFPSLPIFVLDKDTAATEAEARMIAKEFKQTDGAVMIGTELALHHLESVDRGAIVSIDHLFSLPDFRIGEKIFSLLLSIRNISRQDFIIETRRPDEKILEYILAGDLGAFYRSDLVEREKFGYPPFVRLVKISLTADERRVRKEIAGVEKLFEGEEIYSFPAFVPHARGKFTMHALLKLPPKGWPDPRILEKLRSLPPYFSIRVDPENLL